MLEGDDADAARPPRQGLRVLLLEHDAADAERCVLLLQRSGYAVTADTVANAREFRTRLRAASYDVVLADYRLPGCPALDALAAVRAEGLETPLILINGTRMDERAVECIEGGAAGYLIRGNLVHLPGAVRRVLDERRRRQVAVAELQNLPAIEIDGRQYTVVLRVHHDGIEYVGRLWFTNDAAVGAAMPDRGSIPGRTPEDVWSAASGLGPDEVRQRLDRALAERRRFHRLRRVTDEILSHVRSMNQVAIAMRAGLPDFEDGRQEINRIERQLHELVDSLRSVAGIES